jgi:hypothetical protein
LCPLFHPGVLRQGGPNDSVMITQCARVGVVAQPAQEGRRTLDIGEEEGERLDEEMLRDLLKCHLPFQIE